MRQLRVTSIVCGVMLAGATTAVAQTATRPRWEIEGYGGIAWLQRSSDGDVSVPAAGASIVTSGPISPSRATASWFIGDGAVLLNSVNFGFGLNAFVTPIDGAIPAFGRGAGQAALFGARLRRTLRWRWDAEASIEIAAASSELPGEVADRVEATRASYESAFRALFQNAGGLLNNIAVSATGSSNGAPRRELTATGAINWRFGSERAFSGYATGGAGVITDIGERPGVVLEGRYRFVATDNLGAVSFDEIDRVVLSLASATTVVGVAGGGLRRSMSSKWVLQFDVRVLIGENATRVRLDATPVVAASSPGGHIEAGGIGPTIQFSNDPGSGRRSSLSAPPIHDFDVFTGSGLQFRTLVTVGIVRKF